MARQPCQFFARVQGIDAPMTGAEFRQIRRRALCTQVDVAAILNLHPITISAYERDIYEIPRPLAILMRLLNQI